MSENNQKQDTNPMFLLSIGLGFVLMKLYEKQAPKVAYYFHAHQFQIMGKTSQLKA